MKTIPIPLLHDHHSHYALYATLAAMPSLAAVSDLDHARAFIRSGHRDGITFLLGWNSSLFPLFPGDLGDDAPVVVMNLSLHGMVMNHPAEEYLSKVYPDLALNHRDPLWMERNLSRILRVISSLVPPLPEQVMSFGMSLRQAGVAAMEDMVLPDASWLGMSGSFPIPVDFWADEEIWGTLTPGERSSVKGVKMFADGALGTRTASIEKEYISGGKGILLFDDDELSGRLSVYMAEGVPLAIHAIGDRAVKQVVNTVSRLRRERGCCGPVRIEHAQFITPDDAFLAKEAGIALSMQPNFSLDSSIYTDRLPEGYPSQNNPFRMLIDRAGYVPGRDLLLGSDGMPHGMIPALESALFPPFPGQVLTVDEFVAGYCLPHSDDDWRIVLDNGRVRVAD